MKRGGAITALVLTLLASVGGGLERAPSVRAGTDAFAKTSRMGMMRAAARQFGVPVRVLLAVAYVETRWEPNGDTPSVDGGYGVMDLTAVNAPAESGRGDLHQPASRIALGRGHGTLQLAARLLAVSPATVATNERQNVRGAAAVLAHDARLLNGGALPASLGGWYGAVAEFGGATTTQVARIFADEVFAILRRGASLTTSDGQAMELPAARDLRPDQGQLRVLRLASLRTSTRRVDCPRRLKCTFIPAAYARDGRSPANYGNYATAHRPGDMRTPAGQRVSMKIRYIIIHDTEGSFASAISTFRNPRSYASANYVVRSSDGAVVEMVRPHDVSWGAGDWYINMHAISIENEGFAAQGAIWYTRAEYRSDAALVRYLAARYHIPLDRQHILGHEDVPGPTSALTAAQHWDPGPFWNWNHFMALVHRVGDRVEQRRGGASRRGHHHLVTIDPTFATNEPVLTNCTSGGCTRLPRQPANFVYLRTGPGGRYPLVGDPLLHPGGRGTTVDSDWGDKATIGETFVFAGRRGNWTAIWFAGRKAWLHNPRGRGQTVRYRGGEVVTPRPGLRSIPVFGVAYPSARAYPAKVPVIKVVKLAYRIRAGQAYPTAGLVATDYYYAPTINSSRPHDHTVIVGGTKYDQISFNHRKFFVPARDVTVRHLS
jgi:N-acetyl-anhydromuramyl-L-alanine amidase AmpD